MCNDLLLAVSFKSTRHTNIEINDLVRIDRITFLGYVTPTLDDMGDLKNIFQNTIKIIECTTCGKFSF